MLEKTLEEELREYAETIRTIVEMYNTLPEEEKDRFYSSTESVLSFWNRKKGGILLIHLAYLLEVYFEQYGVEDLEGKLKVSDLLTLLTEVWRITLKEKGGKDDRVLLRSQDERG